MLPNTLLFAIAMILTGALLFLLIYYVGGTFGSIVFDISA